MSRIGTRRALLYRPPAAGWSPADWWTVAGQTCVAAYQPKGATDLAASYVNLANPGTNNAAPGTAPTFDTATGWTFTRASSQYLTTGILPTNNQTWSIIVRFSGLTLTNYVALVHCYDTTQAQFGLLQGASGSALYYRNGGQLLKTVATSGVLCVAGNVGYKDGTAETGTIGVPSGNITKALTIGASNEASVTHFLAGDIQALAIYSTTLSASDVAALTTAMNLL